MKLTVFCLFAVLTVATQTASAQSATEHLPVTDAEKIASALRAAPKFITDGATLADYPARAANFEFSVRAVVNGLAYRVHHPAKSMTTRDVSIGFSFSL
jgi:hypothetical protein